jgi:hypothetical protein
MQHHHVELEERQEQLEQELHAATTRLKASEALCQRFKASLVATETKLKRAQDSERAAMTHSLELESQMHDSPSTPPNHELWELTAQCVVASYKQRLVDEQERADDLVAIAANHIRALQRYVSTTAQHAVHLDVGNQQCTALLDENKRLRATIADMTDLQAVAARRVPSSTASESKLELVQAREAMSALERQNSQLKERLKRAKAHAQLLEEELATVYRQGITAKEVMLAELTRRQAASDRFVDDETRRNEAQHSSEVWRLQQRIQELETQLDQREKSVALNRHRLQSSDLMRAASLSRSRSALTSVRR